MLKRWFMVPIGAGSTGILLYSYRKYKENLAEEQSYQVYLKKFHEENKDSCLAHTSMSRRGYKAWRHYEMYGFSDSVIRKQAYSRIKIRS